MKCPSLPACLAALLAASLPTNAEPPADPKAARHWAFQPVRNPELPALKADMAAWARTPLDRFIAAKWVAKGLTPSPPADPRALIRRVTFDLIGLPPTPEELDEFVKEWSATPQAAYENLVERLLASPHYGEHWARHWLDVARYADTKGYVFFQDASFPWAWTYRDYVIEALNADLPYDRFLREQIAADLLPSRDDKRPLRALGFLTLGGRFMNNQHDILDDRIDVVTRGLLGLTVSCARCHDHKFDPVPTKDYYALYAVFAACAEPEVPPLYEPPPKTAEYEKFAKELSTREGKLRAFLERKRADLKRTARERVGEYLLAAHRLRDRPRTDDFMLIADGNDLNPKMIVRYQAFLERRQKQPDPVFAAWHAFAALPDAEFAGKAKALAAELGRRTDVNPVLANAFLLQAPVSMDDVARRYGAVLTFADRLGRRADALMAVAGGAAGLPDPAVRELRQVFDAPFAPANVAPGDFSELELLPDRAAQGELQKFRKEVEQWRASGTGAPPRAMVLDDLPAAPRQRVFLRGNPTNLGEPVERQFLGVLSAGERKPFTRGSGRLELAEAIADAKNPLTAQVIVNRVWAWHFGRGLVTTPSDFGTRSDPPSHPELLDHLASTFVADGWSLKKLHRRIVLSATYRQASKDRPECLKVDPEDVLLWKMPRRRFSFEESRDALLAVSGRLDRKVGGPSAQGFPQCANRRRLPHL
jgi:hypothetical protein